MDLVRVRGEHHLDGILRPDDRPALHFQAHSLPREPDDGEPASTSLPTFPLCFELIGFSASPAGMAELTLYSRAHLLC